MRIGELSRRTGVAPRLLRYYEQQGLITARRSDNGYRAYDDDDVERVERVAQMIRSGLPSRLVRAILDLEGVDSAERAAICSRDVAEKLTQQLHDIEDRISCLSHSRDTIQDFLSGTEHGGLLHLEARPDRS